MRVITRILRDPSSFDDLLFRYTEDLSDIRKARLDHHESLMKEIVLEKHTPKKISLKEFEELLLSPGNLVPYSYRVKDSYKIQIKKIEIFQHPDSLNWCTRGIVEVEDDGMNFFFSVLHLEEDKILKDAAHACVSTLYYNIRAYKESKNGS